MIDILRNNNFATPEIRIADVYVSNKRAKQTQRRILKGFNINTVESALAEAFTNAKDAEKSKDFFKVLAKAIGNKDRSKCLFEKNHMQCCQIRFDAKLLSLKKYFVKSTL